MKLSHIKRMKRLEHLGPSFNFIFLTRNVYICFEITSISFQTNLTLKRHNFYNIDKLVVVIDVIVSHSDCYHFRSLFYEFNDKVEYYGRYFVLL